MKDIKSEEDLVASVEKYGMVTIPAGHIHSIFKHMHVLRSQISARLEQLGMSHYPDKIPRNPYTFVRIVRTGSPRDQVIQAVVYPSPDNDDVLEDATILYKKMLKAWGPCAKCNAEFEGYGTRNNLCHKCFSDMLEANA